MASYTLHIQYVDRPAETRTFTQAKITFGRDAGDVVLHDSQVSGRHGEISFDGNTLRYTDVGSTNGSFLMQGQRVANIELTPGIALRLGNSLITVQAVDAPNVAGKGRTVIAGPGMAPGFPAPMRPPGPGPVVAAGAPIPRPPAPQPVAPGAPPPGGFAFAPTAQMQSPLGGPAPVAPRPGFSSAPPQPGFSPAPPQPVFAAAPQPVMPAAPMPMARPPGPAPGMQQPQYPQYQPQPQQPQYPQYPQQPQQEAEEDAEVDLPTPLPAQAYDGGEAIAPLAAPPHQSAEAPTDLVSGIKMGLAGSWALIQPVFMTTAAMYGVVYVSIATVTALLIMLATLLPSLASLFVGLAGLLSLALLAGMIVVVPAMYRHVLGAYLNVPIDPREAIQDSLKNIGSRVHIIIAAIPLGLFAGPIYFVEGKKLGDNIRRNWELLPKDIVTILLCMVAVGLVAGIATTVIGMILGIIPYLGPVLAAIVGAVITSGMAAFSVGLSVYFYFNVRRRFEGGDPEAEGQAALAGIAALPQG